MSDVRHRIFVGAQVPDIDAAIIVVQVDPFTADSTLIFADSTIRTADETYP